MNNQELRWAAFEGVLTFLTIGIFLGSFPSADRVGMTTIWGVAGASALMAVGGHVFAVAENPYSDGLVGREMEGERR